MIERAMWIASGNRSGLVLMMMELDAPEGYTAFDTMRTATIISIDDPTFLGSSSPGKVGTHTKYTQGHTSTRTHKSMHSTENEEIYTGACGCLLPNAPAYMFLLAGQHIAQKSKTIDADACGSMEPHALA